MNIIVRETRWRQNNRKQKKGNIVLINKKENNGIFSILSFRVCNTMAQKRD